MSDDLKRFLAPYTPRRPRRGFWDGPIIRPVKDYEKGEQQIVDDTGAQVQEVTVIPPLETT